MKKFYSFMLLAVVLLISANTQATDVSTIGELQAAVPATGSAEITLTADISTDATALTVPEGVTVTLNLNNHSITVENTPADLMDAFNNGLDAIVVDEGATLTVNGAGSITCHFIYADDYFSYDSGCAITSNGTLTLIGDVDITGGAMGALNADPTSTVNIGTDFTGTVKGGLALPSSCVSGGYWESSPQMWLASGYGTEEVDGLFHVIESDVVYVAMNYYTEVSYETLEAAINDADDNDWITLLAAAPATVVSKEIVIDANGFDYELITAGEGYVYKDEVYENMATRSFYTKAHYAGSQLRDFLEQEDDGSYVLTEDADISNAGAIHVKGTKTLTINEGVEILYKRQWSLANIVVDNGAKLTVLGSGTFQPVMHSETRTIDGFTAEISATASNQIGNRAIDVDGELIVGVKDDDNNCPHFITSSIARGNAVMVNATGVATFNNADMKVACASIKNYGDVTINGGEYKSIATCKNGINGGWYAYHLNNEGVMTVNDGHFVGVQGAFSNTTANAIVTINGGSFETVNGHNWATGEANTGKNADNHYALYVACYSVVNVYGGYYKVTTPSAGGGKVVLVGNNDAYNTYGIVNLYGGYFQRKVEVSPRKNAESSYPASIPSTSQWYGCFGSLAPLPAGYEYYDTGDATYPYGVRAVAGKEADAIDPAQQAAQEANPTYTIPWQQATTWAAAEVPEENTIVTIPVDATVTVSKDEAVKDAVADQVYVSQGATLKIEEGTTLTVGESGMNIAYGGQIIVEPGATLQIGAAGVVTSNEDAIVIDVTEEQQGNLLYDPAVAENTQPKATVKLYTYSKQTSATPWNYVYQRFAIPMHSIDAPTNDFSGSLFTGESVFESYLYRWSDDKEWENFSGWSNMEPFKGYLIANNSADGGVTYTFTGNLIGNNDGQFDFNTRGYEFFGNSYTAPIYLASFLQDFAGHGLEGSVWVYNYQSRNFDGVNMEDITLGDAAATEIASMQAFILRLTDATSGTAPISYSNSIWGNPRFGHAAPAPAMRRQDFSDMDYVRIMVESASGMQDRFVLSRSDDYTASFDNGSDISKYIHNEGLNLYANTSCGQLSRVATPSVDDLTLGFRSKGETTYTLRFAKAFGESFTLRDNVTGAEVLMSEGATYTFNQAANTSDEARFTISAVKKTPTAMENVEAARMEKKGIYSMQGQYLGEDLSVLPAGVYIMNGNRIVK